MFPSPETRAPPRASISRRPKPPAAAPVARGVIFDPVRPDERQHQALRESVAGPDLHRLCREVEDLDLDLVSGTAVVAIDDPDAVGHHQAALERGAAAREHAQEVASRNGNDETLSARGPPRLAAPSWLGWRRGRTRRHRPSDTPADSTTAASRVMRTSTVEVVTVSRRIKEKGLPL